MCSSDLTMERLEEPGGNIDYERFLEEVGRPLKEGLTFSYRPYQCATGTLGEPVVIRSHKVTLIEGSYSHHPKLCEEADLSVLLTVDQEEQLRRIVARNGERVATVFKERWIPMEMNYFNTFQIKEKAQFHFDTTQ